MCKFHRLIFICSLFFFLLIVHLIPSRWAPLTYRIPWVASYCMYGSWSSFLLLLFSFFASERSVSLHFQCLWIIIFFSIIVIRCGLFYAFALSCKRYEFMNFWWLFFFVCFALNFIYYVSFGLIYLIFRRNLCRFALHFIILQFFIFFF